MNTTQKTQIYVGTYSKYNEGSIYGKWVDLTDLTEEEFYNLCKELHQDEQDPEFMFQDIEANEILKQFISEDGFYSEFWEIKETLKELTDEQIEAFEIFVNNGHPADIKSFQNAYKGFCDSYNIERDFGQEIAEEMGYIDEMPEAIRFYFDAELFGRDLLQTDFWEHNGHIFYTNY